MPFDSPEVLTRFESELPLVELVARQLRGDLGQVLEFDDMMSFGREGLLEAARRYDPERGVAFRRFANYRVRGAILDGMRSHGMLPRRTHEKVRALQAANLAAEGFSEDTAVALAAGLRDEAADQRLADQLGCLATAMAIGFGDGHGFGDDGETITLDRNESPQHQAERTELMALVRQELKRLPELEATFVRRHFLQDENIDRVAADLGLSKSWGSRILARAVSTLARRIDAHPK